MSALQEVNHPNTGEVSKNTLSRRRALRLTLGGAAALSLGMLGCVPARSGSSVVSTSIDEPYARLGAYKGRAVPAEFASRIYRDMAAQTSYPTISQVGNILLEAHTNPAKIAEYEPILRTNTPLTLAIDNLGVSLANLGTTANSTVTEKLDFKSKSTGEVLSFNGVKTDSATLKINLDARLIEQKASPWALRFLVAKEGSHLLHYSTIRQEIIKEVEATYDFDKSQVPDDILIATAFNAKHPRLRIPALSPTFEKCIDLLDFCGYWQVSPDLAKLEDENKLTPVDIALLQVNLGALKEAKAKGLITKPNNQNSYSWTVGPLNKEWISIIEKHH